MKNLLLLSLMLSSTAFAGAPSEPPKPVKESPQAVANGGYANSEASADADSNAVSVSNAHASQHQDQTASASSTSEGSSANNSLSLNYERSAPGLGQGSLYIPQCGVAGNAGGSNSNGAGFLGFAFTPKDCKLLLTAAAYQALGMYDSACLLLNEVSVAKKLWGDKPPKCQEKRPEPPPVVSVPPAPAACPTVADQRAREDLILRKCVSK